MYPLQTLYTSYLVALLAAVVLLSVFSSLFLYLFGRNTFPNNAPARAAGGSRPIFGAGFEFFQARWDFHSRAAARSMNGAFSYYVGPHPVIGITGEQHRKMFFEHKGLNFSNAYTTLFGGGAEIQKDTAKLGEGDPDSTGFGAYFNRRLIAMLKGNQVRKGLPNLLKDCRTSLEALAKQERGITDPFESIYRIVFQLTMRTVAANEIAEDLALREQCLTYFEMLESSTSALGVMYPWLPLPSKAKRTYAGARLYMIFKNVVDERKKHNRTESDALQYLMDQGDSIVDIITFVLGSLFAGQLNSGINAAYLLCFLGRDHHWKARVIDEVHAVANKYSNDRDLPLREQLMSIPLEAWEAEFPVIDMCLKDSIRLNLPGTAFRQNLSGQDIPLNKSGTEAIPHGAFITYATGETNYNPNIYPNPDQWDPARYLPERAEDKKELYAWTGWGIARHPCLGMRFAKLEMSMIVSFFITYFPDFYLCDKEGARSTYVPLGSRNALTAKKPETKVYIKLR